MSFSGEVKEELLKQYASSEHCIYAELAAIVMFGDRRRTKYGNKDFLPENEEVEVLLSTENDFVRQKAFTLCKKNINIKVDKDEGILAFSTGFAREHLMPDPDGTLKRQCCKRAFLRGAYLCIGSMSDPGKSYHLEFDCIREERARLLQGLIAEFDIPAKIALRKKYYVVYMKEGSAICDMLNTLDGPQCAVAGCRIARRCCRCRKCRHGHKQQCDFYVLHNRTSKVMIFSKLILKNRTQVS